MTPPLVVKTVDGTLWYVDVTPGKPDRKIAPYPNVLGAGQGGLGAVALGNLTGQSALYVQGTENISIGGTSLAVETFQPVAPAPTAASVTAAATTGTNAGLASAGLLAQYQSATTAMPTAPTALELTNYSVIQGYRTLASGAQQPVTWNRTSSVWQDSGVARAVQPSVDAVTASVSYPSKAALSADAGLPNSARAYTDGSGWDWTATGTIDNGLLISGQGGGYRRRVVRGPVMASWFGVLPSATGAVNSAGMQQCLDAVNALGGGDVYIGAGTYQWGSAVKTYGQIRIRGAGRSTALIATTDIGFFYLPPLVSGDGYYGVQVGLMQLKRNFFPGTGWELDLPDCINAKIYDVQIDSYASVTNRAATSGLRMQNTPGVTSFMAQIQRVWCGNGSIWIEQTDSRIEGCYVWSHLREYGIRVRNSGAVSISNTDIVPSPIHGGVWGDQSSGITVADDVRLDGSYAQVGSGWGVNIEGGSLHSIGGYYYQEIYGAIRFSGVTNSLIRPATVRDCNRINDPAYTGPTVPGMNLAYPDYLLENSSYNTVHVGAHVINNARNLAGGGGAGPVVAETGTSNANVICNGVVTGTYSGPLIRRLGASTQVTNIAGSTGDDITRRYGNAATSAGATFVAIAHGLGVAPRTFNLTPTTTLGNAKTWWAGTPDANNLYINFDVNPVTVAPAFNWEAKL